MDYLIFYFEVTVRIKIVKLFQRQAGKREDKKTLSKNLSF